MSKNSAPILGGIAGAFTATCGMVIFLGPYLEISLGSKDPSAITSFESPAPIPHQVPANGIELGPNSPTSKAPATPAVQIPPPPNSGINAADEKVLHAIYGAFAMGDYGGALNHADQTLASASLNPALKAWIVQQMPALLISAGWLSLKLGDCDKALILLERAALLGQRLETTKGLAVCHFKQKNLISAEEQFHAYFTYDENDPSMRLLWVDLLETEARYEEAVTELEKIQQSIQSKPQSLESPLDREQISQRLTSMRGRAKISTFQRAESTRHFRLSFQSGEHEELVAWIMGELETSLENLVENFGFKPPPSPIEVILYPATEFAHVSVGSPTWAEGIFDGRIRIPIRPQALAKGYEGDAPLATVLRHELVHALFAVLTGGRSLPPWVDEGLAQKFSCPRDACERFVLPATPGTFLDPTAFVTPFTALGHTMAGRAYQQSLYLILNIEEIVGDGALKQLVSQCSMGSDLSSDGLLKPLGLSFTELHQKAAFRWQKRWIPPSD